MVYIQTGFHADAHCWKCFKPTEEQWLFDGRQVLLCKGCQYEVKKFSNWLNAYGLGIRSIPLSEDESAVIGVASQPAPVEAKNGFDSDPTIVGGIPGS